MALVERFRATPAGEVRLRPVEIADLESLYAHQADPLACERAGFVARDRASFDAHWASILGDPEKRIAAVLADGELVGNVGAWGTADERLVGYWIAREHWNRGIASRALAGFLELERVRPLFAHVVRHNSASIRVLEKCGFVERGGVEPEDELVYRLDRRPGETRASLREARRGDIPAMHRIRMAVRENRLVSTVIDAADYEREIEVTGRGWVVELDGAIVGFAVGNARTGNVWALFVDPAHERAGHGRRLLATLVEWLQSRGLARLWLTTAPDTRAARLYAAAGWSCVGRNEHGELRFELLRASTNE